MRKQEAKQKIEEFGDAIVTYRSLKSKKLKYNVVTLDFNNPYIASKKTHANEDETTILAFSWDADSYRLLKTDLITSVVPLSSVMKKGKSVR